MLSVSRALVLSFFGSNLLMNWRFGAKSQKQMDQMMKSLLANQGYMEADFRYATYLTWQTCLEDIENKTKMSFQFKYMFGYTHVSRQKWN